MSLTPDQKRTVGRAAVLACLIVVAGVEGKNFLASRAQPRPLIIPDVMGELGLKPRTVELTAERAARARDAILKGDYAAAQAIIQAELAHSKMGSWRFHPFDDFVHTLSDVINPEYGKRVDAWVAIDPSAPLPLLVRARYEYDMAWAKRGSNYRRQTQAPDLESFDSYMRQADTDIDAVLAKDTGNPYSYALKLRILHCSGPSPALQAAFNDAIAKYPSYYPLYSVLLETLQPKWGGSVRDMEEFADTYAGKAPATSPLKMLYLELYSGFVDYSYGGCSGRQLNDDGMRDCITQAMRKLVTPGLESAVNGALQLYKVSDRSQYDLMIIGPISLMLRTPGAGTHAGAILQLAADAADSDTQIIQPKGTPPNDYAIDLLAGVSWAAEGNMNNATQKDAEALRDLAAAKFPDEEARDLAYAEIFEYLAGDYDTLHQYENEIAVEKAAIAYGGPRPYQHLICNAYVQLQHYQEAVDACTAMINGPGGIETRYWRSVAYHYLNQPDAEAADQRVIADSENARFRTNALIGLSVYYAKRQDYHGIINLFDSHRYAFDESSQRKDDLAVVYNNRCYAYMQLGALHKALNDCMSSLQFGNLPDAFHKQQELISRLKADPKL